MRDNVTRAAYASNIPGCIIFEIANGVLENSFIQQMHSCNIVNGLRFLVFNNNYYKCVHMIQRVLCYLWLRAEFTQTKLEWC